MFINPDYYFSCSMLLLLCYVYRPDVYKSIFAIDSVLVNFMKRKKLYIFEANQFSPILSWFSWE